jgi:excisionase family DNA binding protein
VSPGFNPAEGGRDEDMNMNYNKSGDDILTTSEVAGLLGIHQNTVRRWSDLGLLRSFRISQRGDRRYKYEDISSFLGGMNNHDFSKY